MSRAAPRFVVTLDPRSCRMSAADTGSETTNSLPAPASALVAFTRPPCNSTSRRTTLSPIPNPLDGLISG